MRHRKSHRGLTNSRIYQKGLRYYLFSARPVENPKTGKIAKWHSLCAVDEGEDRARELAAEIRRHNTADADDGNMPACIEAYRVHLLKRREPKRPREPARAAIFQRGNDELTRLLRAIADAFKAFDVDQVLPVDIARFVDQWEGQRMAQVYKARLSDFFAWCARKGYRRDNPAREVKVEKPQARDRYITHAEFHAVRDALMIGKDGKTTQSGAMVQCYVDLCYLLYQRTTEIRLLKWQDVDLGAGLIHFKPTKTEASSGARVSVPVSQAVRDVLERARKLGVVKSMYVIHNRRGQSYGTTGIGTAWSRACARAGVQDATLKDLRAKAATDAKKAGFKREQIAVGLAHSDEAMTDHYLRGREAPVSEVVLVLPVRPKN